VFEPPAPVAAAFAEAFSRVVPESPFAQQNKPGVPPNRALEAYRAGYAVVADTINDTGLFAPAESAQFDWEQTYSRDEWLRLLPTTGGLTRLDPERRQEILAPVGRAIDDLGGHFTMAYVTLLVSAERRPR
jgi:hypothetical protein